MGRRAHSSRIAIPVGSCLTLTLVLVATLAPQPAGAAASTASGRTPQNMVWRSAGAADLGYSCALLLDGGSYSGLPLLLRLEPAKQARVTVDHPALPAAQPRGCPLKPRAP
jgi:hypothetical protein